MVARKSKFSDRYRGEVLKSIVIAARRDGSIVLLLQRDKPKPQHQKGGREFYRLFSLVR
jgi:hypothetical protein